MADQPRDVFDLVEEGPGVTAPDRRPHERERDVTAERHPTVEALQQEFSDALVRHEVTAGDQHVVYVDPERSLDVLSWLRDDPDHRYDFLADVTAVDWGGGRPIQVVYQLWSIPHARALRVKCELPLSDLEIASVSGLWKSANWLEREVYDMFGVEFTDHPDLRRILMPENYAEGHPLRKDFPLRGRFSRAEQTRRALSQDPHDYYIPLELELGGETFQQAKGQAPTRPPLAAEEGERAPPEATTSEPDMFRKAPHEMTPEGDEEGDTSKRQGVPEEGRAAPEEAETAGSDDPSPDDGGERS